MQIVKLNLIPGGVLPVCFASQHDTGRVIRFMLFEGENVFTLSGAETIALRLQKPDGSELVESVTNTGADYVDVVTTADTCDTAGASVGEIVITDGGDVLGSANFGLFVESDAFEGGGIVTQTASGPIATFETNIETAFVSLKSDINPVQDLHGYSKPWSGGGGKNKLKPCITNGTVNGITYTVNDDGTIRLSNTATSEAIKVGNFDLKAGSYIYTSGVTESFDTFDTYLSVSGTTIARGISGYNSFTLAQDSRVTFGIRVRNGITPNVTIKPMIRLASVSGATFEPYENICPISGFNSANIVGGKNLWNSDLCVQAFIGGDGKAIASAANITQNFGYYSKANQSITISANTTVYNIGYCVIRASDGVVTSRVNNNNVSTVTVTPTENSYIKVWISKDNQSLGTLEQAKAWAKSAEIQIEFGTSRTAYGGEVAINIPFGQTVYGGSLDVTNGKVTITHISLLINSLLNLTRIATSTSGVYRWQCSLIPYSSVISNMNTGYVSSKLENAKADDIYRGTAPDNSIGINTSVLYVRCDSATTVEEFNNLIGDTQLVYELATPIEIDTTPENLTAIVGVNNVYADTNGDTEVEYYIEV